ncbi:MAG: 30S ribosomal protein S16 [Ignavibacteriales bacterium]|nr:30S ribosomal protein S16 [Ignavibacteriales bacterium]
MVKLRLRRAGKKKYPIYKIVAADMRSPRDGKYIEAVGQYNPNINPISLSIKEERVFHWLRKGAQPTDTVRTLLRRNGLWLKWTLQRRGTDEAKAQSIIERWQMQQAEKSKREADKKVRRAVKKKAVKAKPVETAPAAAPAEAPAASA